MITKINKEDILEAQKLIKGANKISIIAHIGPDGDALGSTLGLFHYLKALNKESKVILPDSFSDNLSWLPCAKDVLFFDTNKEESSCYLTTCDLILFVDFNEEKRCGEIQNVTSKLKTKRLLFDHHPYPNVKVDVSFSYPEYSSACEVVYRFIYSSGDVDKMTMDCANCLFTGMMTDTGGFSYNSNNPEMYYIIYSLLQKGVNKDEIYNNLFNNNSENRLRLQGYVLNKKMVVYERYHTSIITIENKELLKYKYKTGDTEGFVNIPLGIKGIYFSVFIKETPERIKLSFRSLGDFPANKVAKDLFNGGGHLNAAGAEYSGKLEDALHLIEDSLAKYIK